MTGIGSAVMVAAAEAACDARPVLRPEAGHRAEEGEDEHPDEQDR
jgi:hypothetical protein